MPDEVTVASAGVVVDENDLLDIESLLDVKDVVYVTVNVPEWKKRVRLGSVDAGEMISWLESNEGVAKRTAGLRLLAKSLVDKNGKRIGDERTLEGLKKKNPIVIGRLCQEAMYLNGVQDRPAVKKESLKNDSSEAGTDASLSV